MGVSGQPGAREWAGDTCFPVRPNGSAGAITSLASEGTEELRLAWACSPLEFPESDRNGLQGCADGRQKTSEDAHHQSEQNAQQKKIEGDLEGESHVGERLKVHGAGG
jgi:hypothetical protein